jgi:hypothetical protein
MNKCNSTTPSKDIDPIGQFDFEEFFPLAGHEQFLWGHSAALCASLLAGFHVFRR